MTYIRDIEDLAEQVPYGEVSVKVERHAGKTTKLTLHTYDSKRFDDNADSAAYILQSIKDASDLGVSGSITFTVMLKSGKIRSVIQQGYEAKDYR